MHVGGKRQRAKWNILGLTLSMENRGWVVHQAHHYYCVLAMVEIAIIDVFL